MAADDAVVAGEAVVAGKVVTVTDDVVATQVRHLTVVVMLTLVIAIVGFIVLANTDLGAGLSFAWPVAVVGTAGGTVNAARRVQRLQQEPVELQQAVPERLAVAQTWLSPITGGVFAVLLYNVFMAGLVQGEVFPAFACGADAFTDYRAFSSCNPATNADAAMAIVWGFIAGFAERFVPNVLDRFIGESGYDEELPPAPRGVENAGEATAAVGSTAESSPAEDTGDAGDANDARTAGEPRPDDHGRPPTPPPGPA